MAVESKTGSARLRAVTVASVRTGPHADLVFRVAGPGAPEAITDSIRRSTYRGAAA